MSGVPGPIPARAGQPTAAAQGPCRRGAYPRSRGATAAAQFPAPAAMGLSPLARGNLNACRWNHADRGPIPARAGQPRTALGRAGEPGAYPRSRGATHTGRTGQIEVGAYPRSRGATKSCRRRHHWLEGLSPLARGNLVTKHLRREAPGPIPARAGQPRTALGRAGEPGAYPRSRGATFVLGSRVRPAQGLSPLARGNLERRNPVAGPLGPIPARAGQPRTQTAPAAICGAYPRSRGATSHVPINCCASSGLSPLARGNPWPAGWTSCKPGPIPARAGQPLAGDGRRIDARAYPRSRGATAIRKSLRLAQSGLSPLARGNLSPA